MQACKSLFSRMFLILQVVVILVLSSNLYAQTEPQMPEFPSMPEVTMPVTTMEGSNFYRPEIPFFQKPKSKNQSSENVDAAKDLSFSAADSTNDLISSFLYGNNILTAKDITNLSDSGLFNNLSSIQGTNYSLLSQTSSTDVLLQQVLASLDDLKKNQSNNTKSQIEIENEIQKDLNTFKRRNPGVLRFVINGYDLMPSLTTIFFSDAEEDGSFLMTGDRKYYANKKTYTETFYLLFKAEKSANSALSYKITPSLVQNVKNENSFVYQMAKKGDLRATKTGNLVVVHYSQNNWNMDMLLDIDLTKN